MGTDIRVVVFASFFASVIERAYRKHRHGVLEEILVRIIPLDHFSMIYQNMAEYEVGYEQL
jgi:hypothetical protein